MGKISAIFLQDYSPQYISQCFVWSRLQRCKWCRFYCSPKGRLSSLITFTVRKFYWCSNCFSLPDFTLLLPVVNSRRRFWVVLLPGCSGPSCTQVFLLIFHRSPSRWWTFGSRRACKFELSIWSLPCVHTCPLHKCTDMQTRTCSWNPCPQTTCLLTKHFLAHVLVLWWEEKSLLDQLT